MVEYSDVQTALNTNWNPVVIAKPTFVDKRLRYSTLYPGFLYISVNEKPMIKDASMDGRLKKRVTPFRIYAVYDTLANAKAAVRETGRILTTTSITSGQWTMSGEAAFFEKRNRIVAVIPCLEWKFAAYTDW